MLKEDKTIVNEFTISNLVDGMYSITIAVTFSLARLSPNGRFLSTWERYQKPDGNDDQHKNLCIFNVNTGELLISLVQKSQNGW